MYDLNRLKQTRQTFSLLFFCAAALSFYVYLIFRYPGLYWHDAHIRLALRDEVMLESWLPLTQLIVHVISRISHQLELVRIIFSLISVSLLALVHGFMLELFSEVNAYLAFVFLAFSPMFTALATVPYPDILFLCFTVQIIRYIKAPLFSKKFYLCLLFLNLASLTRYEGWFLAVQIFLLLGFRMIRQFEWRSAIRQLVFLSGLCFIIPISWLAFGIGYPGDTAETLAAGFKFLAGSSLPIGSYLIGKMIPEYLFQFSKQFVQLLLWQIQPLWVVVGLFGLVSAIMGITNRINHLYVLVILIIDLFLLAVVQPWKFGNLRQTFLIGSFLLLYASYGCVSIISKAIVLLRQTSLQLTTDRNNRLLATLVGVGYLIGTAPASAQFVSDSINQADFQIPRMISKFLIEEDLSEGAILLLDDTDFYPYAIAAYAQIPLNSILDDRFRPQIIEEKISDKNSIVVIPLFNDESSLTQTEMELLTNLEDRLMPADRLLLKSIPIWHIPTSQYRLINE